MVKVKRMRWAEARLLWVTTRAMKLNWFKSVLIVIANAMVSDPLVKIERGVE